MPNEYGTYYPGTNTLVTHSFDERQLTAEFDDALLDQASWKNSRYDGSKLKQKKINAFTTPTEGLGEADLGGTFIVGSDYLSHEEESYQNLPTITNTTTALYIANTVIGGTEDGQFATLKGHSYVGINKIVVINLLDDSVQVWDRATEPYEEFHRYITNDFPTGAKAKVKIIDESIGTNLKAQHFVKMNKGYLLKSFSFKEGGEFSGSSNHPHVLTENNSMFLYKGGTFKDNFIRTGSESGNPTSITLPSQLRFRYANGAFFAGSDTTNLGNIWDLNRYGPSFASSSIHENKFTQEYYTGSYGIIKDVVDTSNTSAAHQLRQSALGTASMFLGVDSINFLSENNADTSLTEQEKTEMHITFFEGTKDFTKGVSESISANDERSISTFEVDQNQSFLQLEQGDSCNGGLPVTHELVFKGPDDGRFMPTTHFFNESIQNGHLASSSLLYYTASNPNSDGCVPITSSLEGGGISSSLKHGHHSASIMMHGINVDRVENISYYVQGGPLGEIGRFGATSASAFFYTKRLIDKPFGLETMNSDNFYSGSFSYEMSFLDKDHTLIMNIDKDAELFNGIGQKGLVILPEHLNTEVRFKLEFYLEKAGIIGNNPGNTSADINSNIQVP